MKKKNKLFRVTMLLITASFLISTILSMITISMVVSKENKKVSMLFAENIYYDIDSRLQQQIVAGKALANNIEIIELLQNEQLYSREDLESVFKQILGKYASGLGYNIAFVISNQSGCYFTQNGFNKVVSPNTDEHDIWYSDFLSLDKEYVLDIDVNEADNGVWTTFTNVRVIGDDGNTLGVCGVGTEIKEIQAYIDQMQQTYEIDVSIVDSEGLIKIDKDISNINTPYNNPKLLADMDDDFHYNETNKGFTVTKSIDELGWSLIISRETSNFVVMMELIAKNLIVMVIVFIIFYLVASNLIRKGNRIMAQNVQNNSYGALAQVYDGMYILDVSENTGRIIKPIENGNGDIIVPGIPLSEQVPNIIAKWALPENAEDVRKFTDISTLRARMGGKPTISFEFIAQKIGWCRLRFIEVKNPLRQEQYIFAIASIDEEKREQEALRKETEEAKNASEAKGRFLANMSHEIRTPINAVLGMDTMILRESKEPHIREYANGIKNAGQTLLSLINDILDFSKIESGKLEIVNVEYDFASLVYDVANMIRVKSEAKGLELIVDVDMGIPCSLFGDDVRIRQVLVNLLTNAVKYTETGSVTFSIKGETVGENEILHFVVKDTGIGIKEEDMGRLFADFERIEEKRNRNIEGTGLGMSITMQLLELMNSKLNVKSVYGEGSEFYFEISQKICNYEPVGDIAKRMAENAESYEYDASLLAPDAKVLVVDDNATNRMVFRGLLKETGVQIDEASGGQEALDILKERAYDIVFLDHMMPEMDGIEVMKKLLEDKEHPNVNTPIIALTANAISGAKENYIAVGFTDYLSKPIIPDKLEKTLRRYIPESKQRMVPTDKASNNEAKTYNDLPAIEGIDWNCGYMHLRSDALLHSAIDDFYNSIEIEADYLATMYGRIVASMEDVEAMDNFRIKVHALKSTSNLIGAFLLAGNAAMLEFAAREGNRDLVIDVAPYFINSLREHKEKLKNIVIAKEAKAKKPIVDKSEVIALIDSLVEAMQVFDVHESDRLVDELDYYEYPENLTKDFDKLKGYVSNLDVDQVEIMVKDFVQKINEI